VLSPAHLRPGVRVVLPVAVTIGAAAGAAELYNSGVAPWLVERLNGYRPDFGYQQLDIGTHIWTVEFWRAGWLMMRQQAAFSAGGIAIATIAAAGFVAIAFVKSPSWRVALRDLVTGVAGYLGCVLLASLMILRHFYVATIPDHAYWYNFLAMHGVVLMGATVWLTGLSLDGAWRRGVWVALVLFVVVNFSQIREHRHAMLASPYLAAEYAKSREMIEGVERIAAGVAEPGVARWMTVGPAGGVVRLPIERAQFFPDTLDAILATRASRAPFDRSLGTHWLALRDFYAGDGSPLNDEAQIGPTLDAWRAVGIREVRMDLSAFADRRAGERLHGWIHGASGRVAREEHRGAVTQFTLADVPAPAARHETRTRVSSSALAITVSDTADAVPHLVDGNVRTRWTSGREQRGDEWIRVAFDRPRDVARLRLELERRSYTDYPRGLRIESIRDGASVTLFDGSALPAYAFGLLLGPLSTAGADIDLPANRSDAIVIRQTAMVRMWFWSVSELAVWER
jgi:hypothetical protein